MEPDRTVWMASATHGHWRLDQADVALKDRLVSLVIVFDGPVDEGILLAAVEEELTRYPIFQAEFYGNGSDIWLQCGGGRTLGVPVTTARIEGRFASRSAAERYSHAFVTQLLPKPGSLSSVVSLLAIQITNFPDACAIGVVWNHGVSDLHGIYGFLRDVFSRYCGAPSAEDPTFDRDTIWGHVSTATPSAGPVGRTARDGIVKISPLRARLAIPRYIAHGLFDNIQLCLHFELDDEVANHIGYNLSANDLILANLLKIYDAVRPRDERKVPLYFPIDIRRLLGISGVAVANCIGNISLVFTREQITELSITSLAKEIRCVVARYSLEQLRRDRLWAEYWRGHTSAGSVYHHWLFGASRLYSSSWMSQEITDARLGQGRFLCLLRAPTLNRLPLPAFHSTVMPYRSGGSTKRIVRVGLRRREASRLHNILPAMPHIRLITPAAAAKPI